MKPIIRINDLIDQHGDTFTDCPGCSICKEIENLREQVDISPEKRFKHILDKGDKMTKSEIIMLLENEVTKNTIREVLGMDEPSFRVMMANWGLRQKYTKGVHLMKINQKKYNDLKAKGYTDKAIATENGISTATLCNYKKKWNGESEYQQVKEEVAAAASLDENIDKALRNRISELEQQVKEYPILIEKIEKLEEANVDLGNEKDRLLLANHKQRTENEELKAAASDLEEEAAGKDEKINNLTSEILVYQNEVEDWKQKAHQYAQENEKIQIGCKEIRNILESQNKELKAYKRIVFESLAKEVI